MAWHGPYVDKRLAVSAKRADNFLAFAMTSGIPGVSLPLKSGFFTNPENLELQSRSNGWMRQSTGLAENF